MQSTSNEQSVAGLLTDPTCPHCRASITTGALLRSHADDLWEALGRAITASDLPADVSRAEALDLSAELGAAYWRIDGSEYRFVPVAIVRQAIGGGPPSYGWEVYRRPAEGGRFVHQPIPPRDFFSETASVDDAAVAVIEMTVRNRLHRRFTSITTFLAAPERSPDASR